MSTSLASLEEQLHALFASDPTIRADPFPLYRRLREEAPVCDLGSAVVVSRYATVREILLDPETFSNEMQRLGTSRFDAIRAKFSAEHRVLFDEVTEIESLFLTQTDREEHDRRRDISRRLFTRRRIQTLEEQTQQFAEELCDEIQARDEVVDFVEFSYRLPSLITSTLLGVPREDTDLLVGWGDPIMLNIFGDHGEPELLEASHAAHQELAGYLDDMVAEHRSGRRPTELFGALIDAEQGDVLNRKQLVSLFLELLLGGYETSRIMLSEGMHQLLRDRRQWEALVDDPSLAANATEEASRFSSPSQWSMRVPRHDIELEGVPVPADTTIVHLTAAANRDPEVFDEPERFDIERSNAKESLAFGLGKHYCLGQALARLEGRIAFGTLASRFPGAELAIDTEDVSYMGNTQVRRIESLPVRLHG